MPFVVPRLNIAVTDDATSGLTVFQSAASRADIRDSVQARLNQCASLAFTAASAVTFSTAFQEVHRTFSFPSVSVTSVAFGWTKAARSPGPQVYHKRCLTLFLVRLQRSPRIHWIQ
eukprot:3965908-Lingulodinium_polyedra.AAC.1